MNTRLFKSDKQMLIAQGQEIISSSDDAKYIYKVTIVGLHLNGMALSDIAKSTRESERTLALWVKAVDEGGYEALKGKKQPDRPSKLSKEQKESVRAAILQDPSSYGYSIWDGASISSFIFNQFGESYSIRQSQRLLKHLRDN